MPYREKEISKLYYSIGEVAEMLEVKPSLIRFWEKEFPILQPKKNKKGNRLFTDKDLENLKLIHSLLKDKGYKIEGAKKILRSERKELSEKEKLKKQLLSIKSELQALHDSL